MNPSKDHRQSDLPQIVFIVIVETARLLRKGAIPPETFAQKLERLECEELERRGLRLLVRELPEGRLRFLIKGKRDGTVREMIEFPTAEESSAAGDGDGARADGFHHSRTSSQQTIN